MAAVCWSRLAAPRVIGVLKCPTTFYKAVPAVSVGPVHLQMARPLVLPHMRVSFGASSARIAAPVQLRHMSPLLRHFSTSDTIPEDLDDLEDDPNTSKDTMIAARVNRRLSHLWKSTMDNSKPQSEYLRSVVKAAKRRAHVATGHIRRALHVAVDNSNYPRYLTLLGHLADQGAATSEDVQYFVTSLTKRLDRPSFDFDVARESVVRSLPHKPATSDTVAKGRIYLERALDVKPPLDRDLYNSIVEFAAATQSPTFTNTWLCKMLSEGHVPTPEVLLDVITCFALPGELALLRTHNDLFLDDLTASKILVRTFGHGGVLDLMEMHLDRLMESNAPLDAEVCVSAVSGYSAHGDVQNVLKWLEKLRNTLLYKKEGKSVARPWGVALHSALGVLASRSGASAQDLTEFVQRASEDSGLPLQYKSYALLVQVCAKEGKPDMAEEWMQQLRAAGYTPSESITTMYQACVGQSS